MFCHPSYCGSSSDRCYNVNHSWCVATHWLQRAQGNNLGAYKLARMAFDKLGSHRIPPSWLDQVDLTVLTIQSKPFSDKEVRVTCPRVHLSHACSSRYTCLPLFAYHV
jgi:hypothetical protein